MTRCFALTAHVTWPSAYPALRASMIQPAVLVNQQVPEFAAVVTLDYCQGAAGVYEGFDRFGRVAGQVWRDYTNNAYRDRYGYGYDRDANRLYRENLESASLSELYHADNPTANTEYDGLNRLTRFRRGTGGLPWRSCKHTLALPRPSVNHSSSTSRETGEEIDFLLAPEEARNRCGSARAQGI